MTTLGTGGGGGLKSGVLGQVVVYAAAGTALVLWAGAAHQTLLHYELQAIFAWYSFEPPSLPLLDPGLGPLLRTPAGPEWAMSFFPFFMEGGGVCGREFGSFLASVPCLGSVGVRSFPQNAVNEEARSAAG